jgi:hypothetical protein
MGRGWWDGKRGAEGILMRGDILGTQQIRGDNN